MAKTNAKTPHFRPNVNEPLLCLYVCVRLSLYFFTSISISLITPFLTLFIYFYISHLLYFYLCVSFFPLFVYPPFLTLFLYFYLSLSLLYSSLTHSIIPSFLYFPLSHLLYCSQCDQIGRFIELWATF